VKFLHAALRQYSGSYVHAKAIYTTAEPRGLGGPGSGNFGHSGRPGEVGGSAEFSGKSADGVFEGKTRVTIVNPHSNAHLVTRTETRGKRTRMYEGPHTHLPTATVEVDRSKRGLPPLRFEAHHHQLKAETPEDTLTQILGPKTTRKKLTLDTLDTLTDPQLTRLEKAYTQLAEGAKTTGERMGHSATRDAIRAKLRGAGGPGSGNFGHSGRPGEIGGSSSEGGSSSTNGTPSDPADSIDVETAEEGGSWSVTHWSDDADRMFTADRHAYYHPVAEFEPDNLVGIKGALIQGTLTLKHPKVIPYHESIDMTAEGVRKLKAEGYDGAINESGQEVIAFSPSESFTETSRKIDPYMKGLGGPGSGNFGHAGRPGEVGGSSSEGGSSWTDPGGQGHSGVTWKQPTDPKTGRPIPIKVNTVEDAVKLVTEGKVVEVKDVKTAFTLIDKLADLAAEAKANKGKEVNYDLCQVTVAGTNMFCTESLREAKVGSKEYKEGVPRLDMPQLAGLPEPGSEADSLPKNDKGEVDASGHFIHFLQGIGMKTTHEDVPAEKLRPSQRELVGQNVGGMMRNKDFDPAKDPIFISSDNYVVDGHHRWAATVGRDAEDGKLGDSTMKVRRINAPISEVLHLANEYSTRFGIKQKGVGAEARHAGGPGSGNFGHSGRPGEVGGSSGQSDEDFQAHTTNNPHKSTFDVGTEIQLERKGKPQTAQLHRKEHHGEEWRIHNEKGQYVYSEGFRYVMEHRKKSS